MIKAIVATNNINFVKELIDEINSNRLHTKIIGIATNETELENIINSLHPTVIFLDSFLKDVSLENLLSKYSKIVVELTYDKSSKILDSNILEELENLINICDLDRKRLKIRKELESIGYDFKYKGTHYLTDAILLIYSKQSSMTDNLKTDIYPILAKKYGKTLYNIKTSIDKATDCMYCDCDAYVLQKYFTFYDDTKPTVKQVIYAVLNKI